MTALAEPLGADARGRAQSRLRWELLVNLVRKDLKVKYKNSYLGFLWSLANPVLYLVVFSFVFGFVLRNNIPSFPVYLMSGLLVWNFFAGAVGGAVGSVVGNANLVKKVRFPRSVLPLSSVGFSAVHFGLQLFVLVLFLVGFGYPFLGPQLLLAVPALLVAAVFTVGLGLLVAAVNVAYRDVEHLLEVALLAWFWATPIVYPVALVRAALGSGPAFDAYLANPMATVVVTMQRAIYDTATVQVDGSTVEVLAAPGYSFYLSHLAVAGVVSLALLALGWWTFARRQDDFAEQL